MQWDLGVEGIALLLAMAIGFSLVAQLIAWRSTPHWTWAASTVVYVLSGVFISEVWFGWATEEDLQPNVDGLSRDEVLLIGLVPLVATFLVMQAVTRRRHPQPPGHPRGPRHARPAGHAR